MVLTAGLLGWALVVAADGGTGTARADDPIAGIWILTNAVIDGTDRPPPSSERVVYHFKAGKVLIRTRTNEQSGTYEIFPGRRPPAIDLALGTGADKGKRAKGLYELNGDELKICMPKDKDAERPREVASKKESGTVLLVLKRDKP